MLFAFCSVVSTSPSFLRESCQPFGFCLRRRLLLPYWSPCSHQQLSARTPGTWCLCVGSCCLVRPGYRTPKGGFSFGSLLTCVFGYSFFYPHLFSWASVVSPVLSWRQLSPRPSAAQASSPAAASPSFSCHTLGSTPAGTAPCPTTVPGMDVLRGQFLGPCGAMASWEDLMKHWGCRVKSWLRPGNGLCGDGVRAVYVVLGVCGLLACDRSLGT